MAKQTVTATTTVAAALFATVFAATAALVPSAQAGAPAAAPATPSAARVTGLQRTTLVVSDIERSIDFYQRVGLIKISDTAASDTDQGGVFGSADLPLTADSKVSRLIIMRAPDERSGQLALLWYDRPALPSARGNLLGLGIGDVIIGFEVSDIQGTYSRLSQAGTRFQRTPVRFTHPGADGAMREGQHLLAYDPDGHMVEVTEMDRR
jgi:catechol 2,3-dioxygenase-like lactoylglutathione lyase family enzyme